MKIIFLDIDGVLNHQLYYTAKNQTERMNEVGYPKCEFDPEKVDLINHITDKTGAKIVLSSSWREGQTLDELKNLFTMVGLTGDLIGKTPKLFFSKLEGDDYESVPRGNEIHIWMEQNKDKLGKSIGKYLNYVILDDDTDMLYWQRNNFIETDSYCGITPNQAQKAIHILNR